MHQAIWDYRSELHLMPRKSTPYFKYLISPFAMKQMRRGKICRVAEESWGGGGLPWLHFVHMRTWVSTHTNVRAHTPGSWVCHYLVIFLLIDLLPVSHFRRTWEPLWVCIVCVSVCRRCVNECVSVQWLGWWWSAHPPRVMAKTRGSATSSRRPGETQRRNSSPC